MDKVQELAEKRAISIENESAKLTEQLEMVSSTVGKLMLRGNTLVEKVGMRFASKEIIVFHARNYSFWVHGVSN